MFNSKKICISLFVVAGLMACAPNPSQLKKVLEDNPDVIFSVIEKHPDKFFDVVQKASRTAQEKARSNQEKEESAQLEEEFKNPKNPKIDESRVIHWNKKAPITIVEYSDFQCPYCTRGYNSMKQVHEKYGDKVRMIYKHLPLDFHEMALPAALMYEAIALQSHEKAIKFHDVIFENQQQLGSGGLKYLESVAAKVGANVAKVKKDMESEKVKAIVAEDEKEAREFGFSGTPGFLVNGVSVRGAYPPEHFAKIIDRHLSKN